MKQLLQDLRAKKPFLADVPVPSPQPGMVLVRNAASLVSAGTERALVEFAGKSLLGKARSQRQFCLCVGQDELGEHFMWLTPSIRAKQTG